MTANFLVHDLRIVVVADSHNPSILNPDFLIRRGIVNEDWGWSLKQPPICTPPFSQVVYDSGVSIQAQTERLVFGESEAAALPDSTRMPEIAGDYVKWLPEVNYTAVGINPRGHVPSDSLAHAQDYVKQRFTKEGEWNHFCSGPSDAFVRLTFDLNGAKLALSLQAAQRREALKSEEPAILFDCNIHRDLQGDTSDKKLEHLRQIIRKWRSDYDLYSQLVRDYILAGD